MVEFLSALGPDGWGTAGGLVLLILGGFIWGKIIPQSTHERELKLWQDLAASRQQEADGWKAVAEDTNAIVKALVPQLQIIVDFFSKVEVTPRTGDTGATVDHDEMGGSS
jgi:hypothetical protein